MIGKKWWANVKKRFSPFKKNIFNVRDKHGKKQRVQVVRVSDHKFFKQRFGVYASSKQRILKKMGFNRQQLQKVSEITPMAKVGHLTYQGQVMSFNSALVVRDFVNKNRELLIDLYSSSLGARNGETHKDALKYIDFMTNTIKKAIENKSQPKHDLDYNPGIVERVDHLLLPNSLHGSTPIVMPRLALMSLAELEANYVKQLLGGKYDEFVKKDKLAAKEAFGEGSELII